MGQFRLTQSWRWSSTALLLAVPFLLAVGLMAPMSATRTVASPGCTTTLNPGADVAAALTSSPDGATVCLNSGSYPYFMVKQATHSSYVTLQPTPGSTEPVVINGLRIDSSSFLRFQDLSMTQGFMIEDGSTPPSHDLQFLNNNITGTFGVAVWGASSPVTNVLIQGNYIHDLDSGSCTNKPGGAFWNTGVEVSNGDGITVRGNTFKAIAWHYIQGGASNSGLTTLVDGSLVQTPSGPQYHGVLVDSNLFEGGIPAEWFDCAHLNVWQIWNGGSYDTFSNNVITNALGTAAIDSIMFEPGPGGGGADDINATPPQTCANTGVMTNTIISNNLFDGGDTSAPIQLGDTQGVAITNNTMPSGEYGMLAVGQCKGTDRIPTTNADISHNIVTGQINQYGTCPSGGNCYPDYTAGLGGGTCVSNCSADYNVSQDATAETNFAGLTTHYVTDWTPKWVTTTWNPATRSTPPAGYFQPVGLPFAAGWSPSGSTTTPPTPTPSPTATPTPVSTAVPTPTATPTSAPTATPTPQQSLSIFPSSTIPGTVDWNDLHAVELGLKFQSDAPTEVAGVRFYKSAQNTGTHTGSLWSASGQRLATVTFMAESASGWQTAKFSKPVSILANTTYIVSYHTNTGHYSASSEYFASRGASDGTLHALSNAQAGGNGVFVYGASTFPHLSYKATNYWVDVIVTAPSNVALSAAPAAAHLSGGNPMPLALMVLLAGALFGCTLTGRRLGRLPVKR